MKFFVALTVLVGLLSSSSVKAAVDCQKRPPFMDTQKCCKIPQADWSKYSGACSRYNVGSQRGASPCFVECVFNQSQVLNGAELNMDKVQEMLSNVYQGNDDFIAAFMVAFEKCGPAVAKQISDMKAKYKGAGQKVPGSQTCSLTGVAYGLCAFRNVFIACPTSAWTSTPECENAKEYTMNCESKFGGPGSGPGRRKSRSRRQATDEGVTDPTLTDGTVPNNGNNGQRRNCGRWQGQGGQGRGQGQIQGRRLPQGQGQGQGQGRGQRPGQGRGQGQGQIPGQGQVWRQGQGQGQGLPPRRGQGRNQGQAPLPIDAQTGDAPVS